MTTVEEIRGALDGHTPHRLERTDGLKVAAVAAVLYQARTDVEVLFIHRAEDPADPWSGHMAFPGGRVEPADRHPRAAAERETLEEVALDLTAEARLLGRLSDVAAVGRGRPMALVIEPFVYEVGRRPELVFNHEVAAAIWVPLGYLLDRSKRSTIAWRHGDMDVQLPCYHWGDYVIWGLTFAMVDELVSLVEGGAGPGRWLDPRN